MDDIGIIELLFERSEKAVFELSKKYGSVCMRVAENMLGSRTDAEECVNDTYMGVWETIPPKSPESLLAYVCRLVRNICLDRLKYRTAKKRRGAYELCVDELEESIPSAESAEERFETAELSRYIDEFLDTLDMENRMLFVRRYWYLDSIEELARITNLRAGTVRTRLSRLRDKLRVFLESRGVTV